MFRKLRRRIRKLLGSSRPGETGEFEDVAAPGVRRRKYDSYDSYLRHQAEKLPRRIDRIRRSDAELLAATAYPPPGRPWAPWPSA